jgi:hypothetical protein
MCFFLLLMKEPIEEEVFKTVAALFRAYCNAHSEAFRRPAAPPDALASLKQQFSTLCSECGLKLAKRGQPKSK